MCEIFKDFVGANFVAPDLSQRCPFEKECSQALEDCKMGDIVDAVDQESKNAAVTEEDKRQSTILAALEAEHSAQVAAFKKGLKDRNDENSANCINRVN